MRLTLQDAMFGPAETELLTAGDTHVSTFRYSTGIPALRVRTPRAELIVLPFKGQQIWRASFDGYDVTMRSMFPEPIETRSYLETYGAFLLHCGLTAIGGPGPDDTHPLHGELPNAPFQSAWIEMRSDTFVIGGSYTYAVAFAVNYRATFEIALDPAKSSIDVTGHVENLRHMPMELMYLAHANFRPVDFGELIYAAKPTSDNVRVRRTIPSHISPPPGYVDFIEDLARDPSKHHRLDPDLSFDPEVVFELDLLPDANGWTHAMQRHPDGTADVISHVLSEGPRATRWICRTPDQQGLGIAFPSTAGVEGYIAEKSKGRIVEVAPHDTWSIHMSMGRLTSDETEEMSRKIAAIIDAA